MNIVNLVFARQDYENAGKSIFLAGPTPRDEETVSWRPEAVGLIKSAGFDGTIFIPEKSWDESEQGDFMYDNQIEWEHKTLEDSSAILIWVPRELKKMPAFTTNVEFGLYVKGDKLYYGRPDDAPKNRYLDYCYNEFCDRSPKSSLKELIEEVVGEV